MVNSGEITIRLHDYTITPVKAFTNSVLPFQHLTSDTHVTCPRKGALLVMMRHYRPGTHLLSFHSADTTLCMEQLGLGGGED